MVWQRALRIRIPPGTTPFAPNMTNFEQTRSAPSARLVLTRKAPARRSSVHLVWIHAEVRSPPNSQRERITTWITKSRNAPVPTVAAPLRKAASIAAHTAKPPRRLPKSPAIADMLVAQETSPSSKADDKHGEPGHYLLAARFPSFLAARKGGRYTKRSWITGRTK